MRARRVAGDHTWHALPADSGRAGHRKGDDMADVKTARKTYSRSDLWFANGCTIVFLSALLTISWRACTAGKIPFWSAWAGILGLALVGAGVIVMVVGLSLRDADQPGPG
jgi:hypothetical protein